MRTIAVPDEALRRSIRMGAEVALIGSWLFLAGCTGQKGLRGVDGPPGPTGPTGGGQQTCTTLAPGQTPGVNASIQVSAPPSGSFFAAGDQPVLTIKLSNACGQSLKTTDFTPGGTLWLIASGPRRTLQTTAAVKLLNASTDRTAPDRQHHIINLTSPRYADPSQNNLTIADDGTITYRLAPVSNELPGTYTAGIWAVAKNGIDQILQTADFQIGTASVETYASGNPPATKCYDCHLGTQSGKSYQAHILPGFSPFGNYSLDQTPISNCQLCHNLNGYSPNPIVRKAHAAHRGENQKAPGVAHPEYGLGTDSSLVDYTNISFPPLLAHEKDCGACHVDDRWKTAPSRLACGTCHDNVFFDSGTLNPPRNFGRLSGGATCISDDQCRVFGSLTRCQSGNCIRREHPAQTDDSSCGVCHGADAGLSPIAAKHAVYERITCSQTITSGCVNKLQLTNYAISGGSGPNGAFLVGDTPVVQFKLSNKDGVVSDLITRAALSGNLVASGPSDDRQRIYGPNGTINIKTTPPGGLTFDAGSGLYRYVFPNPIPANAFPPLNTPPPAPPGRPNVSGSYTVYLYVNEQFNNPISFRDYASVVQDFNLVVGGINAPARPRQVISNAACNSCHIETALHGASRRDPEACGVCHTAGAQDRVCSAPGSPECGAGASCVVDTDCAGGRASPPWESCQAGTCKMIADPTPNVTIRFPVLVHKIHFARLLEGYAERNDAVFPGKLAYVGFQNSVVNLSEILLPQDVRNCTKCHADRAPLNGATTCSSTQQCGIGQECRSSKCVNRAWVHASGEVCISCHDSDDAFGHTRLMTYQSPDGPIETCDVCHGETSDFAVEKVHNISNPYKPPYPRTKE